MTNKAEEYRRRAGMTPTEAQAVLPPPVHGSGPLDYLTTMTAPGFFHNQRFTPHAEEHVWLRTDSLGQHHDGDLTIGAYPAAGPIRLHYSEADVAELRALVIAAGRLLAWMEAAA